MARYDYDLLCIGSGPAGQRAAVQAAKLGRRVAVVERQRWIGGVCVDRGTIPSKAFREAVLSYTGIGNRFFLHHGASIENKITSETLLEEVGRVVRNESRIVEQQLVRNNVDLVRGVASFEDSHTVRISSESGSVIASSEKILIASGSKPALYPAPDCDRSIIVTSDDMPFLKKIPRTMIVVGAGIIGLEYASIFAALGVAVTIIDRRRRLLEFLDNEIIDELMRQMRKMNVTFLLEESVETIETVDSGGGESPSGRVKLKSGKEISGELILYCSGRLGATGKLKLENARLKADALGKLKVNYNFQTAVPHIYAAGDVIGFPSLAATSSEQGRLASRHAFQGDTSGMAEHFPLGIYTIPEISTVGSPGHELDVAGIRYVTGVARYSEIARGQILGDDSGLLKMFFDRESGKLLGVHAIGTGVTELIHIGQAVLRLGGGLDYFLQTVFNYPTLAECYKVAAWDAENKMASGG
jgi:NAD(P) transhydrogenase